MNASVLNFAKTEIRFQLRNLYLKLFHVRLCVEFSSGNRTPAKPGIYFKQLSNSTSTITQFTSPPAPLRPSAEREKFSFCFPIKAKGQETDLDKKKNEGSKNKDEEGKEKGEKLEGNENSRIPVSGNHSSVIKSPVNTDDHTSPKDSETLDTAQTPLASNSVSSDTQPRLSPDKQSERESASEKSLPAKKEEQRRSPSPTRKPRPPPLFIPRAVVQGKHTPQPAGKTVLGHNLQSGHTASLPTL